MDVSYSKEDLQQRIRWYINLRWFIVLALGVLGVVPQLIQEGLVHQVQQNAGFVAFALLINGLFWFINSNKNRSYGAYRTLAVVQLAFDLGLMTGVIFANGGIENNVFMIYAIPIFMSGALLGRRAIYLTGLTAAALYDLMLILDYKDILKPETILAPQLHTNSNYVIQTLFFAPAMLLTITVITDFVARFIRDRTALAARLEAVTAQQAELEAIIQSMGSALVAIDSAGKVKLVNNSFEKLTGWKQVEILGVELNSVLPILDDKGRPLELSNRPLMQILTPNKDNKFKVRHISSYYYKRKNGTIFPFVGSLAPILAGDKVAGATTVFDDASSVKQIQQLKDNFVALASHQLKTPLAEIKGYSENMLQGTGGQLNQHQIAYLESIQEITIRSITLINNLLDLTIIEEGSTVLDPRSVQLKNIIGRGLKVYTQRLAHKKIEIQIIPPPKPVTVWCDINKTVEVFNNVLSNAVNYTKAGTTIDIASRSEGGFGLIIVTDHGPGMSQEVADSIFQKSDVLSAAPKAEGGTGIGLYLAKQLMLLQKGDVSVLSSSSKGTSICIKIPMARPGK